MNTCSILQHTDYNYRTLSGLLVVSVGVFEGELVVYGNQSVGESCINIQAVGEHRSLLSSDTPDKSFNLPIYTLFDLIMEHHINRRGKAEHFIRSEHVDLNDLDERARASGLQNRYLGIPNIPNYPKPEFQSSLLKHDTERTGLCHIWKYGGFKDPFKGCYDPDKLPLVWWNLAVTSKEIQSAEKRLLNKTFPNRTEEQAMRQKRFLKKKFAASPAFSEKSRYGSYRFTFKVQEVLDAYSKQVWTPECFNLRKGLKCVLPVDASINVKLTD